MGAVLLALTVPLLTPSPARSAEPQPEPLVLTGSVAVDTYSADGSKLLSRSTYGPETEGKVLPSDAVGIAPRASDSGSSSVAGTAGGCRRVTITNRARTLLGQTAYKFNTWTYWCWTRSMQIVRSISLGWTISDVDSQFYWRGIVNTELDLYDYSTNDGHPRSAFKHYRQGQFENCFVKYGCVATTYPANTLRSYYNGTWAWSTGGAGVL